MALTDSLTTITIERHKRRSNYLEPIAKLNTNPDRRDEFKNSYQENKAVLKSLLDAGLTLSCTAGYIKGGCNGGHKFLKAVFCGKEWCENCGQDGSPTHLRRIGRWIPKVEQIKSLGYYVITIPQELREYYKDPKNLSKFRLYIKRKFQRDGFNRGLIRWHWFGDCKHCKGHGCRFCRMTGISNKYHPHLNILVDGGYISKKDFESKSEKFRDELIAYFKKNTGIGCDDAVYHYSYIKGKDYKRKMHLLKYVTRSTHRNYNKQIAEALKGYRTSSTWGAWKFKKVVKTENSDLVNVTNNVCPCCGEGIVWDCGSYVVDQVTGLSKYKRSILRPKDVGDMANFTHITAGYYLSKN